LIGLALGRAALLAACVAAADGGRPLPPSALAVSVNGVWREWWRSERASARYADGALALAPLVQWRAGADGTSWSELELSGTGEAWRTRLVIVRIDPRVVRLALDTAFADGSAAWTLDRARPDAVVAVNAGQFVQTLPWGWVMLDGVQYLRPSVAPLVSTLTVAASGRVQLTHGRIPDSTGVRWAFQSYPTLLDAGVVPAPLRAADCGVDVAHRDARLALGLDGEGRLLIALTRFDAMGSVLGRVPFGLTTPEMAAVMGALGASDAVLLDGGISAQLLVRDGHGVSHRWPGVRKVPLALIARPR